MTSRQCILALGLLVAGFCTSCQKETQKITGVFSMKINDTIYTVTRQLTATLHDTAETGSFLVISGLTANNHALTVNVVFPDKLLKTGTYTLTPTALNTIGWAKTGLSDVYSADNPAFGASATIQLEIISQTKAKGTFSGIMVSDFDASLTKTVTDGQFDVQVLTLSK